MDILVSQLGECFKAFSVVTEKFHVFSPTLLDSDSELWTKKYSFVEDPRDQYNNRLFPQKMASFRSAMRNVIKNTTNIMDLDKAVIYEH